MELVDQFRLRQLTDRRPQPISNRHFSNDFDAAILDALLAQSVDSGRSNWGNNGIQSAVRTNGALHIGSSSAAAIPTCFGEVESVPIDNFGGRDIGRVGRGGGHQMKAFRVNKDVLAVGGCPLEFPSTPGTDLGMYLPVKQNGVFPSGSKRDLPELPDSIRSDPMY